MIKDLYHVYVALEEAAGACSSDDIFGPCHFPAELSRVPSLERDMAFYFGGDWRSQPGCVPSPAAVRYVQRLREVAAKTPSLLLAHTYTRYLGDLSGGRVLMRVAKKTMELDESGDGVRFYEFDNVPDPRSFKKFFRSQLDSLPISAELASALVDEANRSFHLNMDLFQELDRQMGMADVPVAHNVADPDKCPFAMAGKAASGVEGKKAPDVEGRGGGTTRGISTCPVGLPSFLHRPSLAQGVAALVALGVAYLASSSMVATQE